MHSGDLEKIVEELRRRGHEADIATPPLLVEGRSAQFLINVDGTDIPVDEVVAKFDIRVE